MRRRELLIALVGGSVVAWPNALRAQQKPMPVIGFLSGGSPDSFFDFVSFRQGLGETGYVAGQNVAIEYRSAEARFDRLPALAAELVERKVDVIFSTGGVPGARAAKNATATIPIVFLVGVDPVARGLVDSLARPGGHLTGFTVFGPELNQKRLELLSELLPEVRVIGVLVNPTNPTMPGTVQSLPATHRGFLRISEVRFLSTHPLTHRERGDSGGGGAVCEVLGNTERLALNRLGREHPAVHEVQLLPAFVGHRALGSFKMTRRAAISIEKAVSPS